MYDSTTATDIPLNTRMVAGYVDGIFRWSTADWGRFPNAVHVQIAISPLTNAGQVLDVETGDAFPWEAPGWVLMRRAAGVDPTVYINWSNWGPTRTEFQHRGIPEPHYWLASYDNIPEVPAGTVAKQFANSTLTRGHFDLSAVADYWPGVDRPGGIAGSEIKGGPMTFDEVVAYIKELQGLPPLATQAQVTVIQQYVDELKGLPPLATTQSVADLTARVSKLETPAPAADPDPFAPKGHTHKLVCVTDPEGA